MNKISCGSSENTVWISTPCLGMSCIFVGTGGVERIPLCTPRSHRIFSEKRSFLVSLDFLHLKARHSRDTPWQRNDSSVTELADKVLDVLDDQSSRSQALKFGAGRQLSRRGCCSMSRNRRHMKNKNLGPRTTTRGCGSETRYSGDGQCGRKEDGTPKVPVSGGLSHQTRDAVPRRDDRYPPTTTSRLARFLRRMLRCWGSTLLGQGSSSDLAACVRFEPVHHSYRLGISQRRAEVHPMDTGDHELAHLRRRAGNGHARCRRTGASKTLLGASLQVQVFATSGFGPSCTCIPEVLL